MSHGLTFLAAMDLWLVELSAPLRKAQAARLAIMPALEAA